MDSSERTKTSGAVDKDWVQFVRTAARSVTVTVNNYTAHTIVGSQFELWHGVWRLFPTGTEGKAVYKISNQQVLFRFDWTNPFVGIKTAKWTMDPSQHTSFSVTQTMDERHNMQIQWQINETATTLAPLSKNPTTQATANISQSSATDNSWKDLQTKAARSVTVLVRNTTAHRFARVSSSIPFGTWSKFPPDVLEPMSFAEFGLRSETNVGGTIASATFQCEGELVSIHLENPLIGAQNFYATSSDHFSLSVSAQSAPHSHALILLSEKPNNKKPLIPQPPNQVISSPTSPTISLSSAPSLQMSQSISSSLRASTSISNNNQASSTNVFGVPLDILIKKEKKQNNELPSILFHCCNFLEAHAFNENNLFIEPGKFSEIVALRKDFENYTASSTSNLEKYSNLSVAFVLKQFLQEMPSPLIPNSMASYFVSFLVEDMADQISFVQFYSDFVLNMPISNAMALERICRLLHTLHYGPSTFNAQDAATILGPIVNPEKTLSAQLSGPAFQIVIEHYPHVFAALIQKINKT